MFKVKCLFSARVYAAVITEQKYKHLYILQFFNCIAPFLRVSFFNTAAELQQLLLVVQLVL